MCTAATYKTKGFYFGRTLDYDFSYAEEVVITPRNFNLKLRHTGELKSHHAIIGTAYVKDGYPLYYDAMNECGLCMAGLNFVGNAVYNDHLKSDAENVSQFEFIPYILAKCATVDDAEKLLKRVNLMDTPFDKSLPAAQLHWLIADKNRAITVECVKEGLKIYDNPVGVLTNNPPFGKQIFNLNNYISLSPEDPQNKFCDKLDLATYSRGMGALGLPGDLSSQSRFVRAAFVRNNSLSGDSEEDSVNQFFHILGSVEQQRGCCKVGDKYEITIYTSCCSADSGTYYYTTYSRRAISAVCMFNENLDGDKLIRYPHETREQIIKLN